MEIYIKTISLFGDVAVRISHNRLKNSGYFKYTRHNFIKCLNDQQIHFNSAFLQYVAASNPTILRVMIQQYNCNSNITE